MTFTRHLFVLRAARLRIQMKTLRFVGAILLLPLLILQDRQKVEGKYSLSVLLNSYDNPDNQCVHCSDGQKGCCERNCSSPCDNQFYYCLQSLGSNQTCTPAFVSDIYYDSIESMGYKQIELGGIADQWNGVQLLLQVYDDDLMVDKELVDVFLINISKETPAGTVYSGNYFGLHGIASMNLSFEIKINGSQDNDFCLDHCINEDSCSIVEDALVCVCQLESDADGEAVNATIICSNEACDDDDCLDINSFTICSRFPDNTRTKCEGFDYCYVSWLDSSEAQANVSNITLTESDNILNSSSTTFWQVCKSLDACFNVNCNGGTCERRRNGFVCNCSGVGFSGENCELLGNPCGCINGNCVNSMEEYQCECFDGYTGRLCNVSSNCSDSELNGGNCTTSEDDCMSGDCKNKDHCSSKCVNGKCASNNSCVCDAGFTGQYCDMIINKCVEQGITCSGRGTCVNDANSFRCDCTSGYSGALCEGEPTVFKNLSLVIYVICGILMASLLLMVLLLLCYAIRLRIKAKQLKITLTKNKSYAVMRNPANSVEMFQEQALEMEYSTRSSDYILPEVMIGPNSDTLLSHEYATPKRANPLWQENCQGSHDEVAHGKLDFNFGACPNPAYGKPVKKKKPVVLPRKYKKPKGTTE